MFYIKINIKSAEEAMQKSVKPMLPKVWNDVLDLFPIENQQTVLHALLNLFGMAVIAEKISWASQITRTNFIGLTVMDKLPEEGNIGFPSRPFNLSARKGPWMKFMDEMASENWTKAWRLDEQDYGEIQYLQTNIFQAKMPSTSDEFFLVESHAKGISMSFDKTSNKFACCSSMLGMCKDEPFGQLEFCMLYEDYNAVSRALVSEWRSMDFDNDIAEKVKKIISDELLRAEGFAYAYKLRFHAGERERTILNNLTLLVQRDTKEDYDLVGIRTRTATLILKIAVVLETIDRMYLKPPKKRDVNIGLDAIVRAASIYALSRWTADKLFNIRKIKS